MLEFRLHRIGIGCLADHGVGTGRIHEAAAPVHRHPGPTAPQARALGNPYDGFAPLVLHPDDIAGFQPTMAHVARMLGQLRLIFEIEQPRHSARPAHAVPLITHPTGNQADRKVFARQLGGQLMLDSDKTGFAIRSRETTIFVQALLPGRRPLRDTATVAGPSEARRA